MRYKKYPKYKDSGVEWLGEIPEDWNKTKLKFLGFTYGGLSGKAGKDFNDEDNKLSKPFIPFTNIAKSMYIEDNYFGLVVINEGEEQNRAKKDDLFFLMSSEDYEDLGKSSLLDFEVKELYLNSFCKGFRLLDKDIFPKFLNYLLHGDMYRKLLSIQGNGFTRINLRLEKLNDLNLYLPPLQEQKAIANYLDKATVKIDTLIQKQEKLIELLKEKRQALISHAVTKGLNPDVKMKDSAVEWLGEIPEHWRNIPLRYIGRLQNGISKGREYFGSGYPFVNYSDIYNNAILPQQVSGLAKSTKEDQDIYSVKTGDIFFTRTSETIDDIGMASTCIKTIEKATFSGFTIRFRQLSKILNEHFSKYYFRTGQAQAFFEEQLNLVTRASLGQDILKQLSVLSPPLEEQQAIANYLDDKTSKTDTLITKSTKAIELLKERRTALINAVVTGKIDVREFNE